MRTIEAMAVGDLHRPGRETAEALMRGVADDLNREAAAAGWAGIGIVAVSYSDSDGALVEVEPGEGWLSIERLRAWRSMSLREAREYEAKRQGKTAA